MPSPVTVSRIQNRRGTQAQFDALYPPGYSGIGGYGSLPGFTQGAYPNVLQEGEIGLSTDSRNVYIGNTNAEYINLGGSGLTNIELIPLTFSLPPSGIFTALTGPGISFAAKPFFTLIYGVTDSLSPNWDTVGTTFSRNANLEITALTSPSATSTDTGTELNTTAFNFSLQAVYSGPNIVIEYMHDFPGALTLNTSSISWISF